MLILYMSGEAYIWKLCPNDRFFANVFITILFHSQSFYKKSTERKSPKKIFYRFVRVVRYLSLERSPHF